MSMDRRIGKTGRITSGENSNYLVRIDDDSVNTGGYLIIGWMEGTKEGFDYWVEKQDDLEPFFKESGWNVEWME